MKRSSTWSALILIALVLVLSVVKFANAKSQNPVPSPRERCQPHEAESRSYGQYATDDPHPSTHSVPSVQMIQATPTTDPAPNDGDKGKVESPPDWLTWFTGIIAASAVVQFIAMCVQAHYMRRGLDSTDKALEIAERPYLSIAVGSYMVSPPFGVEYSITNRGRTIAWITSANAAMTVTESEARPEYPQYDFVPARAIAPQSIGTGRSIWGHASLEHAGEKDMKALLAHACHLHFFAFVNYRDARGKLCHSEFGALFRFKHPNSVEIINPADHTYQGDT
jgi:hypothetical protein